MRSLLVLFTLLILDVAFAQVPDGRPYVLVVSMDGFRWDYPEKYELKNIRGFGEQGVRAVSLQPSFPSKTFPNHYTLATGLYPAHHGIVMNSFFDPTDDRGYSISNRKAVMDGTFYGGEPIWVTAETQSLRSACLFWVGSEAAIQDVRPTYWKEYEHELPYEARIDTVMHWFRLPSAVRPHLVMVYFDEPDGAGHDFGTDSPETANVLQRLDSLFGVILERSAMLNIADSLNIILLSDHGMGPIDPSRSIRLDSLLKPQWVIQAQGGNPVFNLMLAEGYQDSVMQILGRTAHLKAWRRGEAPEHLNYRNNPRILDLTVAADSAWSIYWGKPSYASKGTHGYDPGNKDMHAIFMARGPAFHKGLTVPAFGNVNVYGILAQILGLKPAETDGDASIWLQGGNKEQETRNKEQGTRNKKQVTRNKK